MTEPPREPARSERRVECPECGASFARRGIAAHRRVRHGPGAATTASNGHARPAAPLPKRPQTKARTVSSAESPRVPPIAAGVEPPAGIPAALPNGTPAGSREIAPISREILPTLDEIVRRLTCID